MLLPESGWPLGADDMEQRLVAAEDSIRGAVMRSLEQRCMEEAEAMVDGPGWQIVTALPTDLWSRLRGLVKTALMQIIQLTDKELDGYGCAAAAPRHALSDTALHSVRRCRVEGLHRGRGVL